MIIQKFARLWRVEDTLPPQADLIALVSFGATKDGLTQGSQTTMERAKILETRYPKARVVFGAFTFSPRREFEEKSKKENFKDPIFAGDVASTIEEAEKIRASLPPDLAPRTIVVVTDQWHSRSVKTVWTRIWKDAVPRPDIRVCAVDSSLTIDAGSPMTLGRKGWTWALVNVLRQMFLVLVPGSIWLMKKLKLHQPT